MVRDVSLFFLLEEMTGRLMGRCMKLCLSLLLEAMILELRGRTVGAVVEGR